MRVILSPDVAPKTGTVILRPGRECMPLFSSGRVLITSLPPHLSEHQSGKLDEEKQPLLDDKTMRNFFLEKDVISVAGGIPNLKAWLRHEHHCQWKSEDHNTNTEITTCGVGAVRMCWSHDIGVGVAAESPQALAIAENNLISWIISVALSDLKLGQDHALTVPELCWWAARYGVIKCLPEGIARRAVNLPVVKIPVGVQKESSIVPERDARSEVVELQKMILALDVDDESPESFMLRPKRLRWVNEKYTRWVKTQACMCCSKQADDPHHIIGHGQGGMATKAHDLFVIPLCRFHHDELHRDVVAFEEKYGSQIVLLFRFLDRSIAVGVIGARSKK